MDFEKKIKTFIEKHDLLSRKSRVIIGLSGGADSVALLEVLCNLREAYELELFAVHVHHGIRKEAEQDAAFCEELCRQKKVAFSCEYVNIPAMVKKLGLSEEEAGREARYRIFEDLRQAKNAEVIAVAHHQNDQAETILFQLFRGSGLRGLSGMQPKRGHVIRPLLGVSRKEIEAYLMKRQQGYVTDATNASDKYSRNKIRLHILPEAEAISTKAVEHMSHTAGQLQEILDYMVQQAQAFLEQHAQKDEGSIGISVKAMQAEHIALQKMIVTEAVAYVFAERRDITEKHIDGIVQLLSKAGEKTISLPYGGVAVKTYDRLLLKKAEREQDENEPEPLKIQPDADYVLKDGRSLKTRLFSANKIENIPKNDCTKWFDYDKITGDLFLRTREQGDFVTVRDDGARKTLQDYFVNEKIPKSERDRMLVLADGSHIVWVPGKRISAHYKVTEQTKRILEVHIGGQDCG